MMPQGLLKVTIYPSRKALMKHYIPTKMSSYYNVFLLKYIFASFTRKNMLFNKCAVYIYIYIAQTVLNRGPSLHKMSIFSQTFITNLNYVTFSCKIGQTFSSTPTKISEAGLGIDSQ